MLTTKDIVDGPVRSPDGKRWYLALPVAGPLMYRLRDAWAVIRGRAEAIREVDPPPAASPVPRTEAE